MPTSNGNDSPGLYQNPADAVKVLNVEYLYWTGKVTDYSLQLSLAVLVANWAVFPSVVAIQSRFFAQLSIATVLFGLLVALAGSWFMAELHSLRIKYAEANHAKWEIEFRDTQGKDHPWPFTTTIERVGSTLRFFKMLSPIAGFVLFLGALF